MGERSREREREREKAWMWVRESAFTPLGLKAHGRWWRDRELGLGIKRASEERHKRESEHYIVAYILQEWLGIGCCALPLMQPWMLKETQCPLETKNERWRARAPFEIRASIGPCCTIVETRSQFECRDRRICSQRALLSVAPFSCEWRHTLGSRLHNAIQLTGERAKIGRDSSGLFVIGA